MTEQASREHSYPDRLADELDDYEARKAHEAAEQRADFTRRLKETGEGLDRAGREIAELKAAAEDVARRMEALDDTMRQSASTRRLTLNQVWWKLADAGHMAAADIVSRMIDANAYSLADDKEQQR